MDIQRELAINGTQGDFVDFVFMNEKIKSRYNDLYLDLDLTDDELLEKIIGDNKVIELYYEYISK